MNKEIIAFSILFSVLPVVLCFILFSAYWKFQKISVWRSVEGTSNYLSQNLGVTILWFIIFAILVLPYMYLFYISWRYNLALNTVSEFGFRK
jgi:hypothetical protein